MKRYKIIAFVIMFLGLFALFGCDKTQKGKYEVTFDPNGGILVSGSLVQKFDKASEIVPPNVVKEGYSLEWDEDISLIEDNTIVVATWTINKYTITFDTDGGSNINPITQVYASNVKEPEAPEKEGYVFIGWNQDFPEKMPGKDLTIKALWMEKNTTMNAILDSMNDYVTDANVNKVVISDSLGTYTWSTSDELLLSIDNETGNVIIHKQNQSHIDQKVTVFVDCQYSSSSKFRLTKEVTVGPVIYEDMSTSPICTYYAVGSLSAYRGYNERYKTEETYFSKEAKETLDMAYYAFATIDTNGNLTLSSPDNLKELLELKDYNTRVLVSVNGCGAASQTFYEITKTDSKTKKLATNIVDLLEQYKFDGVDIDWEYESSSYPVTKAATNRLFKFIREELDKRQVKGGTPYLLTAAIPSTGWALDADRYDFKTLDGYLDYINIMSYDLNHETKSSFVSPLYTSTKDKGYGYSADYGVKKMASKGFTKSKLIIGAAGYGKTYEVSKNLTGDYPGLGITGKLTKIDGVSGSFASGTIYTSGIDTLKKNSNYKMYIEKNTAGNVVGSYLYSKTDGIFISYDDPEVMKAKYNYAIANNVGVFCWSYGEDAAGYFIDTMIECKNAN